MSAPTGTRQIAICVPDNCGRLIGKRQPASRLDEAVEPGMAMPNFHLVTGLENRPCTSLSVTGIHTGFRNGRLKADRSTRFRVPGEPATDYYLSDAFNLAGDPVPEAPRAMVRRQIRRLEAAGLTATMASELEFYLFGQTYSELADADYTRLRPFHHRHGDNDLFVTGLAVSFLERLTGDLHAAGIEVDQIQGEGGVGQMEVNVAPADPLRACDGHAIFKHVVKTRCALDGLSASFMAKIADDQAGSGGHVHICLQDSAGRCLLDEGQTPTGPAAAFLAGLLAFSGDFMLLHAPYANSYRRIRPGTFTPQNAAWGWENRSCMARLTGAGRSARLEFRLPGADANPYFVYSGLLAAGLAGIERELALPPEVQGDSSALDLPRLPGDLTEAVHAFARSEIAQEALGEDVHAHLLGLAREELQIERARVTDWDRRRCFEAV